MDHADQELEAGAESNLKTAWRTIFKQDNYTELFTVSMETVETSLLPRRRHIN